MEDKLVIIRGAGDLATGVAQSLYEAGFRLLLLEVEKPSAIRRQVALCEAVYDGSASVENLTCCRCRSCRGPEGLGRRGHSLAGGSGRGVDCGVEALGRRRCHPGQEELGDEPAYGTSYRGPGAGFTAGVDVDVVIETKRGHQLGRIICGRVRLSPIRGFPD